MIVFFLSLGLLFWDLGRNSLSNWDEAWLASVAQAGGFWNGQRWWYEPPLLTSILSMMIKVSRSEWWLRSFNAMTGLVLVIVVYWWGKRIFKSKLAGVFSSLVLLSSIGWLFRARQINVDIPLALWLFWAITLKSGFFLGMAAMTKRLSWLLAVPALAWQFWKERSLRKLITQVGLFLLVALPWHIYSYLNFKQEFLNKYLIGFTLGKLTAVNPISGSSALFYVTALRHGMKLWFLAIPIALVWTLVKAKKNLTIQALLIFVVTYLVGLTLSPIKASLYLVPVYPVVAVLIGGFMAQVFNKRQWLGIILVMVIAGFNLLKWKQEWLVPQTTLHQAEMAQTVKVLSEPEEKIYLDDDWLPVAVFYSQRQVVPLRFNRGDRFTDPLQLPEGSLVLTNKETVSNLVERLARPVLVLRTERDLVLLRIE